MMQNPTNISDEDVLNIEKCAILMYSCTSKVTSINNTRLEPFAAKNRTLKNIPPTREGISYPTRLPWVAFSGGSADLVRGKLQNLTGRE